MTPDFAGPFLVAIATFTQLVVAVGIVAIFVAIVAGTWALISTPPGAGTRGTRK
jgi:hypothetical protein